MAERILLIDNTLARRNVFSQVFQEGGYEVVVAGNRQDAEREIIAAVETGVAFSLVLCALSREEGQRIIEFIYKRSRQTKVSFISEQELQNDIDRILSDAIQRGVIVHFFNKTELQDTQRLLDTTRRILSLRIAGEEYILTQNPRNFTVKIYTPENGMIAGGGVVVSVRGEVLTCSHIIETALGIPPSKAKEQTINVYFPNKVTGNLAVILPMKVSAYFSQHDEDLVLLKPVDSSSIQIPHENIAVLGSAMGSDNNHFISYGYWKWESYISGRADGTILGEVDAPMGKKFWKDPIQLDSNQLNRGMSGSAVLDTKRNLVVGLVSDKWFPEQITKGSTVGWAVNAHVLSFKPFCLKIEEEPLPLEKVRNPENIARSMELVASSLSMNIDRAPGLIEQWVGRESLLDRIYNYWTAQNFKIAGIIGFGGEGKSSLARKWIEDLTQQAKQGIAQPEAIFWWSFDVNPRIDEFFETAFDYMTQGVSYVGYRTTNEKANALAGMLHKGRYLFVLDGLEAVQHQGDEQYGLLRNDNLRQFIAYFSAPGSKSFCLITSRAPIFDLIQHPTYKPIEVLPLKTADGRKLLQKIGVKGDDDKLDEVVEKWDGHALTLSLLGSYSVDQHKGDVEKIRKISTPTGNEYTRIKIVLKGYDEILTETERSVLMLFSFFRTPVTIRVFQEVFRSSSLKFVADIVSLNDEAFIGMIEHLVKCRILRQSPNATYDMHQLVRSYYMELLENENPDKVKTVHRYIKDYYLTLKQEIPKEPKLDDLFLRIEAVHHACQCGDYDDAYQIYNKEINQGDTYLLPDVLGAWDTNLSIMLEFFPDNDTTQEPLVSGMKDKGVILNETGFSLQALGRPEEAVEVYNLAIDVKRQVPGNDFSISVSYEMLAQSYYYLGQLSQSQEAIDNAVEYAHRSGEQWKVRQLVADQAWILALNGQIGAAKEGFLKAEKLQQSLEPERPYLYKLDGTEHATFLWRTGERDYARKVAQANLEIAIQEKWANYISQSKRLLAELEAVNGNHEEAGVLFTAALKIASETSWRDVLIEALLARGRWAARYQKHVDMAFSDLNEALEYAKNGGFRIYEADIRIALTWAYLAAGKRDLAKREAEHAKEISKEMGYFWGRKDAKEVLSKL